MVDLVGFVKGLFSGIVTKMLIAVIILLVGFIIGRVLEKLIQRVLHEIEINKAMKKVLNVKVSVDEMVGHFIKYCTYFIAVVMALKQIGADTFVLDLLFGSIIVIIIISVFLSTKDFIPNIIAGMFIHQKRDIEEGNRIKIQGVEGTVVYINLVETKIKTKSGDIIHIPNSLLTKEKVIIRKNG